MALRKVLGVTFGERAEAGIDVCYELFQVRDLPQNLEAFGLGHCITRPPSAAGPRASVRQLAQARAGGAGPARRGRPGCC